MKKDVNYFRAKGSYSRPGRDAKKAAKFFETERPAEDGTDELVNRYTSMTPGEDASWRNVKESISPEMKDKLKKAADTLQKGMEKTYGKHTVRGLQKANREVLGVKEAKDEPKIDGETGKSPAKNYKNLGSDTAANRKPVMVNVNGKKVVRMEPVEKEVVKEKTLTKAELKKREEVAKAIEKDQPNMPMDKKMAIATATAKRVAEMNFHNFRNKLTEAKATYCGRCGTTHVKPSEGGKCPALKEEADLLEAMSHMEKVKFQKVGSEMKKYGATKGGIDKRAFQDIGHMFDFRTRTADGDEPTNQEILNAILQQDTDVRDKMMDIVTNTFGTKWRSSRPSTKEIFGKLGEETEQFEEAVGTAAKYADKKGMMGGKYDSNTHAHKTKMGMAYKSKKSAERAREHEKQDPKMSKGYARSIVDMQKAKKKAAEKGVAMRDYGKDNWKVKNSVKRGKLPEDVQIDEISRATLASYKSKASNQAGSMTTDAKTKEKRYSGVAAASKKLDQKNREMSEAMAPDAKQKRLDMIRKANQKVNKQNAAAANKAMRDAKRGISKDKDYMDEGTDTTPPFDAPYKKKTDSVTDKSGAKHSTMSRVKHLAKMGRDMRKSKK